MDDDEEEDIEEEIEEKEPQVTSSDPNERKLARKLRIERRLEAIRKLNMPEGEEEEEIVEKTLLQQQMQKSYDLLEKLSIEANEFVTNVRVANDSREVDRREEEGVCREKIIEELEEEAASAEEQFNEIAEKWSSIMDYNDPLAIHDDIVSQKEKCDELIGQKNEIITMLKSQIKTAERNFAKDQRKQTEDIESLARRIEKQVTMMRRAYRQELQLIEDVIMVERRILIETNDKRWEELYKRRDHEEEMNSDTKFQQLEEFEEICTTLRINHQEKYRESKIKLENDIEELQRELEQIKALALMNSEKLDYNYQILKKREDENIIIKSQQKRRINKLQDGINTLRKKTRDYIKYAHDEIEHLTTEIRKLQANVLDIEAKADSFSHINDVKYKQIWDLNRKRAARLLNQILTTDRVLHEQQLGLIWVHPEQALLDKTDLPSYKSAMQMVMELYKKDEASGNAAKDGKGSDKEGDLSLIPEGETMAHRRILKLVLKLIADKSGFLIEARLKDILKPYAEHERTMIRVDSVFSALGIKRKEDVEVLLQYFLPYTHCPICMGMTVPSTENSEIEIKTEMLDTDISSESGTGDTSETTTDSSLTSTETTDVMSAVHQPNDVIDEIVSTILDINIVPSDFKRGFASVDYTTNQDEEKGKPSVVKLASERQGSEKTLQTKQSSSLSSKLSCQHRHPLVISSVYILRALKEFVSKFYIAKEGVITMASRLSYKRSTISRLMVGDEVKLFWDRFKVIFSPTKEQLWDGLMTGLHRYHEILKDRKKLNDEVLLLRRQNIELKYLLTCYEKDEKKKMKPPCAMQREIPIKPTAL